MAPPRNEEVARRSRDGGVAHGEAPGRVKHRTVGAPAATVAAARALRGSMTLPEVLLWQALRQNPCGFRFRRQHPVGRFVADFACVRARLAIEIDGRAHTMGDRPERDVARDAVISAAGFETLRVNAEAVLRDVDAAVATVVAACQRRVARRAAPPSALRAATSPFRGGAGAADITQADPPSLSGEERHD